MSAVYLIHKALGETPLQALIKFQEYTTSGLPKSLTYAGRLDPMAEGLLPIVDGQDVELKRRVSKLSKVYRAGVIFGIKSDSADLLGVVNFFEEVKFGEKEIEEAVKKILGNGLFEVPKYSTRVLSHYDIEDLNKGKKIDLPKIHMSVKKGRLISASNISTSLVLERLKQVELILQGNFRHEEIQKSWEIILNKSPRLKLFIFEFEVESGTYIRSIAEVLAKELGTVACLFSLDRIRVGKWSKVGKKMME